MAESKEPRSNSSKKQTLDETSFPYPDFLKSDPVLKSIFDRVRSLQRFKTSEFTHFILPLVKDFGAAAADFMDEQGRVTGDLLSA